MPYGDAILAHLNIVKISKHCENRESKHEIDSTQFRLYNVLDIIDVKGQRIGQEKRNVMKSI